jgi:hypothetical protein
VLCQFLQIRGIVKTRRFVAFQYSLPQSHPPATVQDLKMKAVGKTSEHGFLNPVYVVGYPDHPRSRFFQDMIQPALVLGFSPGEPGIPCVQDIIRFIDDNQRTTPLVGHIQAYNYGYTTF